MTLAADLAADYAYQDGVETVALLDGDSSTTLDASLSAVRGRLGYRELATGIGIQPGDITWTLWAATMAVTPAAGNVVQDSDSVKWTIQSVDTEYLGSTAIKHTCVCRRQAA